MELILNCKILNPTVTPAQYHIISRIDVDKEVQNNRRTPTTHQGTINV